MFSRVALLTTAVLIGVAANSGRPTAAPQSAQPDVLTSLLAEVRGLRAAMERMASAGPRLQLAFGRLQLQEQRISAMMRRLEALREQLEPAARKEEEVRLRVKAVEEAVRDEARAEIREDLTRELPGLRREAQRLAASLLALQNEESTVASQIAAEQGRWSDINRSLEELERSLVPR